MRKTPSTPLIGALSAIALAAASLAAHAEPFTFTDLGTLGSGDGLYSYAQAINDAGQIVGVTGSKVTGLSNATIWNHGVATILDPSNLSTASAINNLGQVVGDIHDPATGTSRAILWSNGTKTDLGALFGTSSYATSINDSGQIVGVGYDDLGTHALIWQNGQATDLGLGFALHNNNAGQVVGNQNGTATIWNDKVPTPLPGNMVFAHVTRINNAGQIAGTAELSTDTVVRWVDSNAAPVTLPKLNATGDDYAWGINDAGQIVGTAAGPFMGRAALWDGGTVIDLNDLLDPGAKGPHGWTLVNALGINNNGWIVGLAKSPTGLSHGFVYAPEGAFPANPFTASVPEPQTCMLMVLGLIGVAGAVRRRRPLR